MSENFSPTEILEIRDKTPGVRNVVHFNNAGASLMPEMVSKCIIEYTSRELNFGGYETAEKYASELNRVYSSIAGYLGAEKDEIAIMENATAAWSQALLSIPLTKGDIILTSVTEYASNYLGYLQIKNRIGVDIRVIPNDSFGQLDIDALPQMMEDRVKLIAIAHVPTNGGLVNPAEAVGRISREHNVWYLLDACQSVGQMPLNVTQLGCDFLSGTSRKYLRGPRGVGFLYVSRSRFNQAEPIIMDLHAAKWEDSDTYVPRKDARKFENWENNLAAVLGLGTAVDYMLDLGIARIWSRIIYLADYLRNELSAIPNVTVQDLGQVKCGIVSFTTNIEALDLKTRLHQAGFNVSLINPAHTLLDMKQRGLGFMIRASIHYYNTEDEVDRFTAHVRQLTSS